MRKIMKKMPQRLLLLFMLLAFLPDLKAEAAKVPFTYPKHVYAEYRNKNSEVQIPVTLKAAYKEKYHYTEKYTKIKASNSKVAKGYYNPDYASMNLYGPYFRLKKTGTTKISFDVTLGTGTKKKTYHCKTTLHVYKYKNPLKKLEIESKNVTSKVETNPRNLNLTYSYEMNESAEKLKVRVTPAGGWKVTKMVREYYSNGKNRTKTVKNGSAVDVDGTLLVTLKNTKTKVSKTLTIWFYANSVIYDEEQGV